jgi:hypothetical protein
MTSALTRLAIGAMAALVLFGVSGNAQLRHERAPFWVIPADDYAGNAAAPPHFPETSLLPADRDIGVAFAGGGVRSAAMTIGELRGLEKARLLPRVRYVSAVSGGAWAVIPWTFSGRLDLLGAYETPGSLQAERVKTVVNGSLGAAVRGVSIELEGAREGGLIAWALQVPPESQDLLKVFRRLLKGARSTDRTYASMLRNSLLAPLGNSDDGDFQLDESHDGEYVFWNGPRPVQTTQPQPGRPFMIVNANVVNAGADFEYPYAIPFEFTPLYVGSRQSVGGVFGGIYTWPSAYNATTARVVWRRSADDTLSEYCGHAPGTGHADHAAACAKSQGLARAHGYSGILEYSHDEAHARVTLPDVAASTGAAPLFFIAGGNGLALDVRNFIRTAGGGFFPQFTHMAIRDGEVVKPRLKWPHADGGARDNLGIAALLARQVKKIIVFANVSSENFNDNDDIASLFEPRPRESTADKRENVMFETGASGDRHPLAQLRAAFARKRQAGEPLVACGRYDVKANPTFNIRAYRDVRVCWVYPERAATWTRLLGDDVRDIVEGKCGDCGRFENFPWFDTFGQNRRISQLRNIGVLKLSVSQVNLMTNLMAWSVAESGEQIREGLGIEPAR